MIYIIFTFILEVVFSFFISTVYQHINMFFPLLVVGTIPIFYLITSSKVKFFITIGILGILYDTLYSDVFLINAYYFLLVSFFVYIFYSSHEPSIFNVMLLSILSTIFYDIFIFFILILTGYSNFKIDDLLYKEQNSILDSLIYLIFSILIFKSRIFGYKKSKYR